MVEIVLTDEQARLLSGTRQPVALRSPTGQLLAYVTPEVPVDPKEVAEVLSRLHEPNEWFTTAEVLEHLRSKGTPGTTRTTRSSGRSAH